MTLYNIWVLEQDSSLNVLLPKFGRYKVPDNLTVSESKQWEILTSFFHSILWIYVLQMPFNVILTRPVIKMAAFKQVSVTSI